MRTLLIPLAAVVAAATIGRPVRAEDTFEGWNLEPGIAQAHLVMVARVVHVGQLTVVEGAKTDVALREYRFQPIAKLKGIFQRDQLSMTASDLGAPAEDGTAPPPLKEGEYRLLILAQAQGKYAGCVSAAPGASSFAERVPLVSGPDDPLVGVVDTLIRVVDSRSRTERAALVLERLTGTNGVAAIPALTSLKQRADRAAADDRSFTVLTRLTRDPAPAVRAAAVDVLRNVLAYRSSPVNPRTLDGVVDVLRGVIESDEPVMTIRVAAVEALGHLLVLRPDVPGAREVLTARLTGAATYAERVAAVTALSRIGHPQATAAVLDALAKLPLDEPSARTAEYAAAAIRRDATGAGRALIARLDRTLRARQPIGTEVEALGRLRNRDSLPLLLTAAAQPHLAPGDRYKVAWALGRMTDDRAVPTLAGWLRSEDYQLREATLTALETVDTPAAAREVRPALKTEPNLPIKLRIARLLARHNIPDGYALATEHLADPAHTTQAALVLAALNDARTAKDLSAIVSARPDRKWLAAALTGLAATGDAVGKQQLLGFLGDPRHPLAAEAAAAAGIVDDPGLLRPLVTLIQSRNRRIALAALTAVKRFVADVRSAPLGLAAWDREDFDARVPAGAVPADVRTALTTAVTALVLDPYVELDVRYEAFATARVMRGDAFPKFLADLTDQAELEGSQLLVEAERELRRLKGEDR
jgi:HEAT repeat protein